MSKTKKEQQEHIDWDSLNSKVSFALLSQKFDYVIEDISEIKASLRELTNTYSGIRKTQDVHGSDIIGLKDKVDRLEIQVQSNRDWRIKLTGVAIGAGAGAGGIITAILNAITK